MIKKLLYLSVFLCCVSSCSTKLRGSDNPLEENDIIYTDSFSPVAYEYPLSRKVVQSEDVDIGVIIDPATLNQQYHTVYLTVATLFNSLAEGGDVAEYFSASAYNSFRLRYKNTTISNKFSLRVGAPATENNSKIFWVNYKITLKGTKVIGRLELAKKEEEYLVSDFDDKAFDTLFALK